MYIHKLFTLSRQLLETKGWLRIKLKAHWAHISTGTEEKKTSEGDRNLISVGVTDFFSDDSQSWWLLCFSM